MSSSAKLFQRCGSASAIWLAGLSNLLLNGSLVSPRGQATIESNAMTYMTYLAHPVNLVTERKLNYSFMAAEALWILAGDDRVEPLTKHVARMADFSDDGQTLWGAYGVRLEEQWKHVLSTLLQDPFSRQAVVTLWRQNPPKSKDVPCTVALDFYIRDNFLHCHAFMRSSDIWLGLPYDTFSFSMIAAKVAAQLNELRRTGDETELPTYGLGTLSITCVSSHLYVRDHEAAMEIQQLVDKRTMALSVTVEEQGLRARALDTLVRGGNWAAIEESLIDCEDKDEDDETAWRIRP